MYMLILASTVTWDARHYTAQNTKLYLPAETHHIRPFPILLHVANVKCCHIFLGLCTICQNNSRGPTSVHGPITFHTYLCEEFELCDMKY